MDILFEIIFEVYLELMFLIVPEDKRNRGVVFLTKVIAILVMAGVIALVVWGAIQYFDYGRRVGIIYFVLAAVISIAQIALGIIFYRRRNH